MRRLRCTWKRGWRSIRAIRRITSPRAMVPASGGSVLYISSDAGRSWSRGTEAGTGVKVFPNLDPVIEFAPDGTPYFATLDSGFTIWRGEDGGRSWVRLGIVPGGTYDRQWIGFDASGGSHHGRLYTAGKVPIHVLGSRAQDVAAFSWSDDGGRSFRQPRLVLPDPAQGGLNVGMWRSPGTTAATIRVIVASGRTSRCRRTGDVRFCHRFRCIAHLHVRPQVAG